MPPIETQPIFFDASGRRASRLRRATQVLGVLALLYVGLLVASLLRVPGAGQVSLPAVGRLFPEATPVDPPSVDAAPGVTVIATPGTGAGTGARSAATRPTTGSPTATTTGVAAAPAPTSVPGNGNAYGTVGSAPGGPRGTTATTGAPTGDTTGTTSPSRGQGPDGSGPPGQVNKASTDSTTTGNGRGGGNPR